MQVIPLFTYRDNKNLSKYLHYSLQASRQHSHQSHISVTSKNQSTDTGEHQALTTIHSRLEQFKECSLNSKVRYSELKMKKPSHHYNTAGVAVCRNSHITSLNHPTFSFAMSNQVSAKGSTILFRPLRFLYM